MGSVYYSLPTFWEICKKAKMNSDTFSEMFLSTKTRKPKPVQFNAMNQQMNRLKQTDSSATLEYYLTNDDVFSEDEAERYSDVSFALIAYAYRKCFQKPVGDLKKHQLLYHLTKDVLEYSAHELQCVDQSELLSSVVNMSEEKYRSDSSFVLRSDSRQLEDVNQEDILAPCKQMEDILALCRKIASDWLETKKGTGRYRGYFYTRNHGEITEVKNKILTKDGRKINLFDMLFHYDESNMHSVNLRGKGGAGKSFQILKCIEQILKEDKFTVPVYIPLSSLGYGAALAINCIYDYLLNQIGFDNADDALSTLGSSVIIFADGLNEISDPDMRRKIARDICELRQNYRTRFLISSRQDHTALFNGLNYGEDKHFVCAEVLDLNSTQIDQYFAKVHCPKRYDNVSHAIRPLLKTLSTT